MRYWWVNQNQTYRHEVQGGYLWSPKRNANGVRNPFYESMREVAPGDLLSLDGTSPDLNLTALLSTARGDIMQTVSRERALALANLPFRGKVVFPQGDAA